jgi:hypothetical protein
MKDLRDAIKTLVENIDWGHDEYGHQIMIVDYSDIEHLIAEYNIHFVEPEDKQLVL